MSERLDCVDVMEGRRRRHLEVCVSVTDHWGLVAISGSPPADDPLEFPFRTGDEGPATRPAVTSAPVRDPIRGSIMHLWALGSCGL